MKENKKNIQKIESMLQFFGEKNRKMSLFFKPMKFYLFICLYDFITF